MSSSAAGVVWNLDDLYAGPDDPAIARDLARARELCTDFENRFRGLFAQPDCLTAPALAQALVAYEEIIELLQRLGAFASLATAANTADDAARRLEDRIRQQQVERENQLAFFELGWLAVDDQAAARLAASPELSNYAHYLTSARRYKPHVRAESEELLLNQKSLTSRAAWTTLFDEFVSSLRYQLEYAGQTQTLTQPEILALGYQPDRGLRQAAQTAFFEELSRHELVLSSIANAVAQDHALNDQIRGYPTPLASRHLANEIPAEVVDRMLEVAEENYPLAHQYYSLKARLLGLPKLATYDQYAPVTESLPPCTFDAARDTVLRAFSRFDPTLGQTAALFFDRPWIDAEVRPGKRGGAFSASTVPGAHPYILLNWTDKLRDVATLAHELGHGVHQYLSRRQTMLNFHHPLTIAETASVFGEFLAFDAVMEATSDKRVQLGLLCGKIEDAFATVFRQTVLTRFEQALHAGRRRDRLSSEELCQLWWRANHKLYGDAVEMFEPYRWGWSYIPHFIHTPFYCYAYVFGELLVLSLYRMHQEAVPGFTRRYLELLASGSNASPHLLLARVGADLSDPSFWQKGFEVLRGMVVRAAALADELQSP